MSLSVPKIPTQKKDPLPTPTHRNDSLPTHRNVSFEEESSEEVTTVNRVDDKASFWATFIDGSSLRYLIEYLRMSSTEGTFIFTKDAIIYQRQDDDETVLNDVRLKT